ncbi:hypothetical protein I6E74_10530 [Salinibacterium sp. SWN139]|uniref:hypothetical protein n=1 Tax=Salinibacterium sp. SWN139 TaxID=2792055 RepID=UPI0018CEFD6F|nr:hypothetical protein [Salinibacterium sp. SWN139]MBH0054599.1 hypothetical protein [Salinibacterium sp. SWN139]
MPVQQKNSSPDFMPVLAAGRHRTPRRGGCFMEFASYLAGEKWSDHPSCTHPALAVLARLVNDCTPDQHRSELVELIPSVIGLTSDDPRLELRIALRAATAALPIASEGRQRALAVGIIATQSQLAIIEPHTDDDLADLVTAAFAQAPASEFWARKFSADCPDNGRGRRPRDVTRMTQSIIRSSVIGIACACSPGADQRLKALLQSAIDDCRMLVENDTTDIRSTSAEVATMAATSRPKSLLATLLRS